MLEKQCYIPEPEEFIAETPLSEPLKKLKKKRDEEVKAVVSGKSEKMLLIIGPCSAHESAPVLEYISRLGKLNERVKDKLVLVPRIYTNKPRTKGVGYKGMFIQPDPDGAADIVRGIRSIRALHIAAMEESGLTAADEMLYPEKIRPTWRISSPITPSAREAWKISFTVWSQAALKRPSD